MKKLQSVEKYYLPIQEQPIMGGNTRTKAQASDDVRQRPFITRRAWWSYGYRTLGQITKLGGQNIVDHEGDVLHIKWLASRRSSGIHAELLSEIPAAVLSRISTGVFFSEIPTGFLKRLLRNSNLEFLQKFL